MKLRDILSNLAEVILIPRGGVKTRILPPDASFVACSVLLLFLTIRGECTQEVPYVWIYTHLLGVGRCVSTPVGFLRGRYRLKGKASELCYSVDCKGLL